MSNFENYKLDKIIAYKEAYQSHMMIDDQNLQMTPFPLYKRENQEFREVKPLSLKNILSDYIGYKTTCIEKVWENSNPESESVKKAIKDAEHSYETMMQIRASLEAAYNDFISMSKQKKSFSDY
jgi:hypothetical protein